ncbi:hypothetical protein M1L60_10150 [Actinoplanes sp. TRM 88003]|uniref:Uncharacterized protein n=1 Tax=Paractinoplanes aksuensis TaxID=2939490 RepID=A0ABT1DJF0_9ACTN|nr:hypothetical protein [Actinoplanes aksuensis]MCO8270954.1 hypothetical protein [Actinoplanes aksuensis]
MADMDPTGGLWNWAAAASLTADRVHGALAGALERNVGPLESGAPTLCDVYHVGGEFPTIIDVYLAPETIAESTAASAVAVRLEVEIILPDDTLDPAGYLLAGPDGSLTSVEVDEVETDEGVERRLRRERPAA